MDEDYSWLSGDNHKLSAPKIIVPPENLEMSERIRLILPSSFLPVLIVFASMLATLASILRSRAALELEILALRHQIGVLPRPAAKRPKLTSGDRLFWICLSRLRRDCS